MTGVSAPSSAKPVEAPAGRVIDHLAEGSERSRKTPRKRPLEIETLRTKAPDPDKAADQYFAVLKALTTGQLKVSVQAYDSDPVTDSIRHIKFKAEFTTPENFAFDPLLKPERAGCPTLSE